MDLKFNLRKDNLQWEKRYDNNSIILSRENEELHQIIYIKDNEIRFVHKDETLRKDFRKQDVQNLEEVVNELLERDADIEPMEEILDDLGFETMQQKNIQDDSDSKHKENNKNEKIIYSHEKNSKY